MAFKEKANKFWQFLKEDSWQSWLVSLFLVILLIKFIFFPLLSFVTGSPLPIVIVESCSMYHALPFDKWWELKESEYSQFNIIKDEFSSFPFKNGLSKGDIIFVWSRANYKKGDTIIFRPNPEANHRNPIIHRLISENKIATKGDNNEFQLKLNDNSNPSNIDETNIPQEDVLGKAALKIPYLGWVKLIFFEFSRPKEQRGFC